LLGVFVYISRLSIKNQMRLYFSAGTLNFEWSCAA